MLHIYMINVKITCVTINITKLNMNKKCQMKAT